MAEVERDRWGRYKLPNPDTGLAQSWTRATTLAKTLDDMTGIHKAQMRDVVLGMGQRDDLYRLAASMTADEKRELGDIADKARAAARADAKSHNGTAIHKVTERVDTGHPGRIPDVFSEEVNAYQAMLTEHKLVMRSNCVERITVTPEVGTAGTFDNIASKGGRDYIADKKTGNVERAWLSIAIQLAVYAHGRGMWNPERGVYDPMPQVDLNNAIVIHMPSARDDGVAAYATPYWVDIATGWEMALIAYKIRGWRNGHVFAKPF